MLCGEVVLASYRFERDPIELNLGDRGYDQDGPFDQAVQLAKTDPDVCTDHDWKPLEGVTGRYVCGCGATGWKNRAGAINAHKAKIRTATKADVKPSSLSTRLGNNNYRLGQRR